MGRKKYQGSYKCEVCNKVFMRRDKFDSHSFTHTGLKKFICDYEDCQKSYINSSHLRRHVKTCHESKPQIYSVICKHPECKQGFTNISNMNRHYKTAHENPLPYKCSNCEERFHRKHQLKRHLKSTHDIGEFTHTCKECGEGFFNSNFYEKHLSSAHKVKQRICPDCNKIMPNWKQLVIHRRSCHSHQSNQQQQQQQLECDKCGKSYSFKNGIRQHMKVHLQIDDDVTIYECHFKNCAKFYSAKRNLTAHIRSKHEGKKFMCIICRCKLSTKQKLDLHMQGHFDPEKAPFLKRPRFAVILGIQMHEKIGEELLLESLSIRQREQTASAESE